MKVLDKGNIEVLDIMGTDKSIISAASISYNKKEVNDNLIYHLMEHKHMSPFEMCEMKFEVVLPIFVARQWVRHRTASINEMSARYVQLDDNFYIPDNLRGVEEQEELLGYYTTESNHLFSIYGVWLSEGVLKEQARCILPLSTYTKWIWKSDLRNIFNFLKLRLDIHAQKEIREYAKAMEILVKEHFPIAYDAFSIYMLNSVTFTQKELACLNINKDKISKLTKGEQKKLKDKCGRIL